MRRSVLLVAILLCVVPAFGAKPEKSTLTPMQMPHVFRDSRGSNWDIQHDGTVGDGGNDLFDGGCRLFVRNQQFNARGPAQMDSGTKEIVLAPMPIQGLNVSRRIGCNQKLNYLRYTEILENTTAAPVKASIRLYFNMGGSVQIARPVIDEKKTKQPIGHIIGDQGNCMVHLGAGRGSKVLPRYQPQQGSDNVNVFWEFDVPAKQTVAITHLVIRKASPAGAEGVLDEISEKEILKELSPDVAKQVINFPRGQSIGNDIELLRGEVLDVVELRSGDQYKGTLKPEKYKLKTFWGELELPASKVVAMVSTGQFRPHHLVVTAEGEIFGGRLEGETVRLELSDGQVTNVPLTHIARVGYRKRADEPEEWRFDKPLAQLRTGERMIVQPQSTAITVATRYGSLAIKPESIAAISFVNDDHGVHEVTLTDGSKFAGLVSGDVNLKVASGPAEAVAFPLDELRALRFAVLSEDVDVDRPVLTMTNGDELSGVFAGEFKLQAKFDTLVVVGAEVRSLKRGQVAGDVQVTLWDGATLSGRLDTDSLPFTLVSGVTMRAPVGLVDNYTNPQPRPSATVMERLKSIVNELNDDDARVRDSAEAQLTQIGSAVKSVLTELRPSQPPEAQQRIDAVLKAVSGENTPKPVVIICPQCGFQPPLNQPHCPRCGTRIVR